ncbi:MAG: hypothetical protein M1817_001903 [Caeruleum heppii]|nr:MAG: hypothetical protein M1817_001903 [Caeruleum heppii]
MLGIDFTVAAVIAGLLVPSATALSKISVSGAKFFNEDGDQFYVKGIAYQLVPDDPLIDTDQCKLDAALMKTLGANAIRVYHVDPIADHDGCMQAFDDAGIYLFVDLDTFDTQIDANTTSWSSSQLNAFNKVLDAFVGYDNTAGVFVGNEILTTPEDSSLAPLVKAAARDVKAYRDSKGYRKVPVGYSAADIASLRPNLQNYLACGSNASEALDFFSLNTYSWCGASGYTPSGYDQLLKNATDYNIPIFISETGCNTVPPRDFSDQKAILSGEMADVWSGAMIYEWIAEKNNYGLISYGPEVDPTAVTEALDGFPRSGTPTPVSPDFGNLSEQWATLTPSGVRLADYTPSLTPPVCPSSTAGAWNVDGEAPLPALGQARVSQSPSETGSPTESSKDASPSTPKKNSASGVREVMAISSGLVGIMLGFVWWL